MNSREKRTRATRESHKLLFITTVFMILHFVVSVWVSLNAAAQADSMGKAHGCGWINSAKILTFPLDMIWDSLCRQFKLPDFFALLLMGQVSFSWALVVASLIFLARGFFRLAIRVKSPSKL